MKLIVGLGNPGRKYKKTKHNIGFMCLDYYAKKHNVSFKKERKFNGESLKIDDLLLLKPHTFMNLSGESIHKIMTYFDVDVEDILIIYDDLALPFGKLRLREKGSSGGHNGIKSIISHVKTENFKRVRVGIDNNPMIDTKDYVLSNLSKKEQKELLPVIEQVVEIMEKFTDNTEFITIMNHYN